MDISSSNNDAATRIEERLQRQASSGFAPFTVDPLDKCRLSEGVASSCGIRFPSYITIRRWSIRVGGIAAILKAIVEDGAPVITYVSDLLTYALA